MKRAILCAVFVGLAAVAHAFAGHLLAGRDVVLSILAGDRGVTLVLVLVLLATRLFLYLLAPGWVLYVVAVHALERFYGARSVASMMRESSGTSEADRERGTS